MSTVVIKLGGASLQNHETLGRLGSLVKLIQLEGSTPVIIHGGGPAINQELTARGISWTFINGQRQTTAEMVEVIEEVLATNVNRMIVSALKEAGLKARGLSGSKDQIFLCSQVSSELGLVGEVEEVGLSVLGQDSSSVPVIAPIGFGKNGEIYNINADWAAAKFAIALGAEKLIFLTDQEGVIDGTGTLVDVASPEVIEEMISSGVIHGGMYTKVKTMMNALENGVGEVHVISAIRAHEYAKVSLGTRLVEK